MIGTSASLGNCARALGRRRSLHMGVVVVLACSMSSVAASATAPETVIAHGRTDAGESFVAKLAPRSGAHRPGCQLKVRITTSGGSDAAACFSKGELRVEASVQCEAGLMTIQAFTRSGTTLISLLLSDGQRIATRAIIVPPRLGGPAGLYYQVVRGPYPVPVSLSELDAHGRVLRVDRLPAIFDCTEHPLRSLPVGKTP